MGGKFKNSKYTDSLGRKRELETKMKRRTGITFPTTSLKKVTIWSLLNYPKQ